MPFFFKYLLIMCWEIYHSDKCSKIVSLFMSKKYTSMNNILFALEITKYLHIMTPVGIIQKIYKNLMCRQLIWLFLW